MQPLVAGPVVGVEQEGAVVLDDPDRQPEAVEDRPHPLRVALGEVVVDGDDVDASPGHRVERGRERRDERLALAGLHLRDAALVQDDAAHQLDVERAHLELAAADLAGSREDVRQDVVEGGLEPLRVSALAVAAQVGAALAVGPCSAPPRRAGSAGAASATSRRTCSISARICSSVRPA